MLLNEKRDEGGPYFFLMHTQEIEAEIEMAN